LSQMDLLIASVSSPQAGPPETQHILQLDV